mgnify:CR=1 FL=1
MKKFFNWIRHYLLMIATCFILAAATAYYFYWHLQPFTQNAFVVANTRPVSALVAGYITEIHVRNNQFVKKGDPLFTTFQTPYQLKVKELEYQLESQKADLLATEARIDAGRADVRRLEALKKNAVYLSNAADQMYSGAAVSQEYAVGQRYTREAAEAQLDSARSTLRALTHDAESARALIRNLETQLETAKINQELTVVRALSDGFVTNMTLSPGGYYEPGEVLFGFVDSSAWWVQANFKENELSGIRRGQHARIWLWQYPGLELEGVVEETGWTAERRISATTGLPQVEKENEWFLLPQRFPVQIRILNPPSRTLTPGGSAFVTIDTPSHPVRQFFWQLFLLGKNNVIKN